MRPTDRGAFAQMLTDALAFYRQAATPFAINVWWQACQNFELEQVGKALTAHAMDPDRGHFPPMPADIVRQLEGTQADRSLVAWGKVYDAMCRVGAYQSVAFDDPAIHAAIDDMGGWSKLCREPLEVLAHTQRRFCDSHRVYSRRPDLAYPPYLPGQYEIQNRQTGQRIAPPVLVGDPKQAQLVIRGGAAGTRTQLTVDWAGLVTKQLTVEAA